MRLTSEVGGAVAVLSRWRHSLDVSSAPLTYVPPLGPKLSHDLSLIPLTSDEPLIT